MCRLALKTASKPFSPYKVLTAMEAMQEGYDGSGLGLVLRGVKFTDYTYRAQGQDPILSGIAHTEEAFHRLGDFMQEKGFQLKYDHEFDVDFKKIEAQDRHKYILRVYKVPSSWKSYDEEEVEKQLMLTRLELRKIGEDHDGDLTVFSFWPDVATIKEVGWPLGIGDALHLNDNRIKARVVMAQGRQNTNYGINLYACHPFFIQGIASMTNGGGSPA
jgi:glutamate synthase domain-containing protein 1